MLTNNVISFEQVGPEAESANHWATQTLQYNKTSMTRTPMARLLWMIQTRFWVPTKFFQ